MIIRNEKDYIMRTCKRCFRFYKAYALYNCVFKEDNLFDNVDSQLINYAGVESIGCPYCTQYEQNTKRRKEKERIASKYVERRRIL